MIGYPKFDLVSRRPAPLPIQANGRPTILYNPHVSPHLSSWYQRGPAGPRLFPRQPGLQSHLRAACHAVRAAVRITIDKLRIDRPGTHRAAVLGRAQHPYRPRQPGLHRHELRKAADIYLGDVSSQVYEFLLRRRPCIFLNSHDVDYQGDANYAHWQTGRVIRSADELDAALAQAWTSHSDYLPAQTALFERSFDLTNRPSSLRAAEAILGYLDGIRNSRTGGAGRIAA